jgi:hypothetical protein
VGLRMAERCSKDFPKRMGTELQATVSIIFCVVDLLNIPSLAPPSFLDRIMAV